MQKLTFAGIALMLCLSANAVAQESFSERAKRYIETYREMAVAEQKRSGVPAAITLGQGIYETSAGASELATEANNHFGIKCKKEWTGETFAHTDDAPDECFRKYKNAEDSYRDHSDYLKSSARYQSCFRQSPTDYASWARELKKCGYATNPQYAQRLIKIIEDYKLQEYTYLAMNEGEQAEQAVAAEIVPEQDAPAPAVAAVAVEDAAGPAAAAPVATETEETTAPAEVRPGDDAYHLNGLKGFYARKGDVLLEQAIKNNIRYSRLLELNDLPDAPLSEDMFIYLERKHSKGARPVHIVQPGETMIRIAQNEGIQLRQLRAYNQLDIGEQPTPGVTLQLQKYVSSRPSIVRSSAPAPATPYTASTAPAAQSEYVATGNKPAARLQEQTPAEVPAQQEPQPAMKPIAASNSEPAPVREEEPVRAQPVQEEPAPREAAAPAVNIADETAVEEEQEPATASVAPAPQPEEPQDELSRLKARLDKAVYGQGTSRTQTAAAAPAPVQETAQATATKNPQYYTVQKGDTAFSIARKHNISMRQLMDWNHLNFDAIKVGQKLKVSP